MPEMMQDISHLNHHSWGDGSVGKNTCCAQTQRPRFASQHPSPELALSPHTSVTQTRASEKTRVHFLSLWSSQKALNSRLHVRLYLKKIR